MPDLRGAVAVVTGASSGLGRAAAVELAGRGATVVLAARRREALEETAELCRGAGARALVQPTDVTREEAVDRLARDTVEAEKRIDVWVNNAGVTLFAPLEKATFEEHRRVIETNLYGAIHGARAVIPIFRAQKSGVLINVGSILSKVGQPYVPSYVISKFGLRGLSEALRTELADEPDIHVCTLLPYAIDTPHFQAGANRVGLEARAMPPVQSPLEVARALVDLAERPRRERHVPRSALLGIALHALLPHTTEKLILHALREWHFGDEAERSSTGNLYTPREAKGSVYGERPPQLSTFGLFAWLLSHAGAIWRGTPERSIP